MVVEALLHQVELVVEVMVELVVELVDLVVQLEEVWVLALLLLAIDIPVNRALQKVALVVLVVVPDCFC